MWTRTYTYICDHIGDLITDDKEGNISKACTNSQKAEVLGNFFASVFVRETHYDPPNSQPRPCQTSFSDPIFSEQVIFDKLKNLNVTKSPGPDSIHPRILYELRHELVPPLKILYDTSYKLNQLPAEWKYAHITAIFKKGSKSDPSNYRPISLTIVICKLMESLVRDHVNNVNQFKARLDKFWMHQDVKFDFTADLTGIGDRSVRVICDV